MPYLTIDNRVSGSVDLHYKDYGAPLYAARAVESHPIRTCSCTPCRDRQHVARRAWWDPGCACFAF